MDPDIHVNPEILRAGALRIVDAGIENWKAQKQAYEAARDMMTSPRGLYWVGGHGGTGRMPAAGNAFLDRLAAVINDKITELDAFIAGMQSHSDNLIALADRTAQADLTATDLLNGIARDLDGIGG